jgi:methylenetetrahydrofolate reductase (NADPH)
MKATNFFLGAVVTNHKRHEREVMPQYMKLRRKIETGARFMINQAGYDARKDDELVRWLALSGLQVPVIANVFVLSLGAARAFNAGRVPGVVVTDELVALAEHYAGSADRGRSLFLELAAKQVAIARGVGFRGAYLGGKLDLADCEEILSRAEAFGRDGWKEVASDVGFAYPDEFYYFERDETTGLSTSEVSRALLASRTKAARRRARLRTRINYRTSRLAHWAVFDPKAPLFGAARQFYSAVESAPPPVRKVLHTAEYLFKVPLYNCKDCGDCSLPEIAYLCPESQCAKNQRNGPCGGSHDGLCEVAECECIWARAYERLRPYVEETSMLDGPVVFNDYALRGTSAWANTLLGWDHSARPAAGQEDVK